MKKHKLGDKLKKQLARVERDWINQEKGEKHLQQAKDKEAQRKVAEQAAAAPAAVPENVPQQPQGGTPQP